MRSFKFKFQRAAQGNHLSIVSWESTGDGCKALGSCGECIRLLEDRPSYQLPDYHHCGWNGSSCTWHKSVVPALNINISLCPYNASGEVAHTYTYSCVLTNQVDKCSSHNNCYQCTASRARCGWISSENRVSIIFPIPLYNINIDHQFGDYIIIIFTHHNIQFWEHQQYIHIDELSWVMMISVHHLIGWALTWRRKESARTLHPVYFIHIFIQ